MAGPQGVFNQRLVRVYLWYSAGFVAFVVLLALAERMGMPNKWIGYAFMLASIGVYTAIGLLSRTSDVAEYYVAGRRVPAIFNGMATAADWMSAASFIGMAGTLYFAGYQGLAFVMGWTGGYVFVALFLAPYLRKFGHYTIPDFLGARYGGNLARLVGVMATILASFVYVVAQIYGVGLVTSRFIGIEFEVGVFVGLAGVLVCSFLGGMRAVTWTQVAQFVIIIVAYLIPVVILSYKVTGVPLPQVMYGTVLEKLGEREKQLFDSPRELDARAHYAEQVEALDAKIAALPISLDVERRELARNLEMLKASDATAREVSAANRQLRQLPQDEQSAREKWTRQRNELAGKAARPHTHAQAFPPGPPDQPDTSRANFIALVICMMLGTASLPHILMRYYTTPSVREARHSVFWSLLCIFLLYVTAPAYAVFAKWTVYNDVVGTSIASLPSWVQSWSKIGLVKIDDVNGDGLLQLAELTLDTDVIVLATPEIAGLPYVVTGLIAAGGMAAALSTADGLLLTISNALGHDLYFKTIDPRASTQRRLIISKAFLLVVAVIAAYTASRRPDNILLMVGMAFSIAASSFFPALVCGVFWKRANKWGAVAGMLTGLGVCLYYLAITHPFFGGGPHRQWFGIQPISCGIFGVPAGFVALVIATLCTRKPPDEVQDLVEHVRYPNLEAGK